MVFACRNYINARLGETTARYSTLGNVVTTQWLEVMVLKR